MSDDSSPETPPEPAPVPAVAEERAVASANTYSVKLPSFEGPLDLLLHLIEEHELDVMDIPIAFVAKKYVEYITLMEELNIDIASEYLVMAATLTHIKSKMLLPVVPTDQEDEAEAELDPRAELVRRLLEYQKYKHAAEQLSGNPVLGRDVFLRGVPAPNVEGAAPLAGLSLFKLLDAFQGVLSRAKNVVDHQIDFERFSITDRINELSEILKSRGKVLFEELFEGHRGRIFCPRDGAALSARAADRGPDPYLGRTLEQGFRVDALIGTGAVGRIYRAHQLGVERTVALKIMHRDLSTDAALSSRFRREARIAGSLSHPNLVNVLLLSELEQGPERVPFLVLEYLDGLSLRSALAAQGSLSVPRALHVLLQIADAVGEAHQHGIVHRDLKPENVMLVQRGEDSDFVKVLDFGVAHAEVAVAATVATRAGAIFGSARYVAPECAAGGPSSPQSDVYALATLGYECLTGTTPFDGDNAIAVLLKQQSHAVPPLLERKAGRATPRPLAELIERNLAKDPVARAADARAFARELLAAAGDSGLDPGLSLRTRRGYAIPGAAFGSTSVALEAASRERERRPIVSKQASLSPPGSTTRRALFVIACFILGAGAALGIATRLGAFAEKPAPSTSPKANPR